MNMVIIIVLMEWFIPFIAFLFTLTTMKMVDGCQIDNKVMHACLHTYLERDFSMIEELLKRPPYSKHGQILLEETELENMCSRLTDLKICYEQMINACVSYEQYSHMKRVIKTIRSLHQDLCGTSFLIQHLIEGGYCIEYARKESHCSQNNTMVESLSKRQRWPLSLASMLRFEVGQQMCPYLSELNECLVPYIYRRCRNASRELWNKSMTSLLKNWCQNSAIQNEFYSLFPMIISLISFLFDIHFL